MENISTIIFDLGGVLLDIDFKIVSDNFKKLGVKDFDDMYSKHKANLLFKDFEKGKINTEDFYRDFKKAINFPLSNTQLEEAWNSLLQTFRKPSIDFLISIKSKYKLFLLSNTNAIHYKAFHEIYFSQFNTQNFNAYFDEVYYSHLLGLRKPDKEIYEFVMEKNNLSKEQTLFIDDSIENIEAAGKLGLQVIHLKKGMKIEELKL